jgi:AraC-like DNA-binding protein
VTAAGDVRAVLAGQCLDVQEWGIAVSGPSTPTSLAWHEQRTRLIRHELKLGHSTRAWRPPDDRLAPLMHRALLGFRQSPATFASLLEPPLPALTLMIDLEGSLRADGEPLPHAWCCGPDETYTVVEFGGTYGSLDIELTPLGAYAVLGRPLHELAGRAVALEDLFGAPGRDLAERLRERTDWDRRFDLLETFLLDRAERGPRPTPGVAWAWRRLRASAGRVRIETLAAELGWSRRYLSARFREQVGVPPKTVGRLMRFEYVRRLIERDPARWVEIAYDAGYCDQSHLNRDFRDLAGTTPTDFLARRIPGGGLVGDEIPFVQD